MKIFSKCFLLSAFTNITPIFISSNISAPLLYSASLFHLTMPTQACFEKYPPFPSDLPVAKLPRVSFAKLLDNESSESDALFESSRSLGFFLLDFEKSPEGEDFLRKAERMFDINEEVNSLDQDELMKYAYNPPTSLFGYVSNHFGSDPSDFHL